MKQLLRSDPYVNFLVGQGRRDWMEDEVKFLCILLMNRSLPRVP